MNKTDKQQSDSQNKELITRTDVKDSPFEIITIKGEKGIKDRCFGAMGQYRITEEAETEKEIKEELEKITWNRIIQVMMLIIKQNVNTENKAEIAKN